MAKTIIGIFDEMASAERAVTALEQAGFNRDDISVIRNQNTTGSGTTGTTGTHDEGMTTGEGAAVGAGTGAALGAGAGLLAGLAGLFIPGIGTVLGVGPLAATIIGGAGIGAAAGGLSGALMASGVSEEDAAMYTESVKRGSTLVSIRAADDRADEAADLLGSYGAVDIDERAASYRNQPVQDTAATRTTATGAAPAALGSGRQDNAAAMRSGSQELRQGEAIPVVEEQIAVGKRQVNKGGVRVYSHVTERPVEEQVTLRDEHINVERRPVNRAASEADLAAFKEGSIEVTETDEEAVVAKRAVVKEEIVVDKTVDQHTETVRDTVRSTDVDVQRIEGQQTTGSADFDTDFAEFRSDRRYAEAGWDKVEPEYRRRWETRNPGGTWEGVKNNARQAWERTKNSVR
ncbi:MAG TPA: YsnF/AvaK domain-containing protein [Tepidisphaeraceae bacterium]|jgi:uncharacterized protein (TIGR02271 family)|nr:YsnF/AvaK domain-containing protein [Tepidisphaeraceae bacterium]